MSKLEMKNDMSEITGAFLFGILFKKFLGKHN